MPSTAAKAIPLVVGWILSAWIVYIFVWYLMYKFEAAQGSVDLFTTITDWLGLHGHEKAMRIGTGVCELVCSVILVLPGLQGLGGIGVVVIMTGAIFFHLASPLGVDPYNDGGILFKEAISVWLSGAIVALLRRNQLADLAARQLPGRTRFV